MDDDLPPIGMSLDTKDLCYVCPALFAQVANGGEMIFRESAERGGMQFPATVHHANDANIDHHYFPIVSLGVHCAPGLNERFNTRPRSVGEKRIHRMQDKTLRWPQNIHSPTHLSADHIRIARGKGQGVCTTH